MEFVLVHGSTQSSAGWDRLATASGTRGHQVTVIDLPPGRPEWTMADYAREASAQAGEPSGRRVVVGHSAAGSCCPPSQRPPRRAAAWLAAYIPDLAGGHSMAEDILPTGDRTLRPGWMRQAARQRLGTQPVEVNTGHCPHVSQPEVIADFLAQT